MLRRVILMNDFFMIFGKIVKFHNFSKTGKSTVNFQGFPGAGKTLVENLPFDIENCPN